MTSILPADGAFAAVTGAMGRRDWYVLGANEIPPEAGDGGLAPRL